jgi:hypothetical protein
LRAPRSELPRHCPAVGNPSQYPGDGLDVTVGVATQSAPWRRVQIGRLDDHETKSAGWDELVAPRVIDGSLLTAMDPAHGQSIGLVEEVDRSVVLEFPVFDDETMARPVTVYGETSPLSVTARVAE